MKKTIKTLAMMLFVASVMVFVSCTKDDEPVLDVETLVGEWECTWSKAMSDYNIQGNAYVGAVWKFGTPSEYKGDRYLGSFNVALDGNYQEGVFGEYHFSGTQYSLPRLTVWISEDNGYMCFNGFHEHKPGDAYRMEADYSITLTDNMITLSRFNEYNAKSSAAEPLLKFRKK